MSVFTPVQEGELRAFLSQYPIGELVSFEGIAAGIENTNYFVTTTDHQLVLTLFEHHTPDELDYFLGLMAHLAEYGVPTAHPLANNQGRYLGALNGKPAALVQRLAGSSVEHPNAAHCHELGHALARFHLAGVNYPQTRAPDRGPSWWFKTGHALMPRLSDEDRVLLESELAYQRAHRYDDLPRGVIHADLFRDNALFDEDKLTGIIDLYYACNDAWVYDLAVTVNDWCSEDDGHLNEERARALIGAYQKVRPFTDTERQAWPVMLRGAALRFWLSRLKDKLYPRDGEMTFIKDPDEFRRVLIARIQTTEDAVQLLETLGC
ncbi:MAG TPA: homoserine kinase [Halothiobacillus sp.]|nr:homoserine kinase [Halothiobacillus sp.]